ncbi:MAG: hypothetical protein ACI8T1_002281 [Verrucomicrobiales bacterium]|jgi:hypothetical protein
MSSILPNSNASQAPWIILPAALQDSDIEELLNLVDPCQLGPHHVMLYGRNSKQAGDDRWLRMAAEYVSQGVRGLPNSFLRNSAVRTDGITILSVRLLVCPSGSGPQFWHLDYEQQKRGNGKRLKNRTVFVNLTKSTIDNCTELLCFDDEEAVRKWATERARCFGKDKEAIEIDSNTTSPDSVPTIKSERAFVAGFSCTVHRAAFPRGTTFHLPTSDHFHRRGANHRNFTRVTLNIDFIFGHDAGDFKCVDSETANAFDGVCADQHTNNSYDLDLI